MAENTIRILVADDHTLLRQALCDLLAAEPDFDVVAQASTGTETCRLAGQYRPDVVILDIEMAENHPATTVGAILCELPDARIIVLSMDDSQRLVRELLSLGVHGYLHKSVSRETLVSAIRQREAGGRRTVTVSVSATSLEPLAGDGSEPNGGLTLREVDVLTLAGKALSNRQIAIRLGIAEGTVKRHLRNVFEKLGAVSRMDAVNKAVARSLLSAPGASDDTVPPRC
ncbi:response regulator transcription factor [Streptomyces sp.]|uniref:response regulator transcription factor n=1 Tax=Streptomyces sp. TaxID=1931 RepID=UPI002F3F27D7